MTVYDEEQKTPSQKSSKKWCSKRSHKDKESAEHARSIMEEKTGEHFKVYQCKLCNKFHIGSVIK